MKKTKAPKIDPYVEGFFNKMLERLSALERKVDVVISKVGQKHAAPNGAPTPAPAPQPPPRRERQLYEAICAECSKLCEVPFQPTESRPVFCKTCWAKRKGQGHGMPIIRPISIPPKPESRLGIPQAAPPAPAAEKKAKKSKPASKAKAKAKKKK